MVLSLLMMLKAWMGLLPQLDVIALLGGIFGEGDRIVGWVAHFAIGIGYGVGLAVLSARRPSTSVMTRAMVLVVLGWLAMMFIVMPAGGLGAFGMALGIAAPIATLLLHLIFGAVLGFTYRALT